MTSRAASRRGSRSPSTSWFGGNSLRRFLSCPHSCPHLGAAFTGQPWTVLDSLHGDCPVLSRVFWTLVDLGGRVGGGGGGNRTRVRRSSHDGHYVCSSRCYLVSGPPR